MKRRISIFLAVAILVSIVVAGSAMSGKPDGIGGDRVLSKITFIHYRRGNAKPDGAGGGGGRGNGGGGGGGEDPAGVYTYIANGLKWKTLEDLYLNPTCNDSNPDGLILNTLMASMSEWETAGGKSLSIFGPTIHQNTSVAYNNGNYRKYNTISFGSYGNAGVIGVTTVWGYFTGPPRQREIVECHILMNDDYVWGDADFDDDNNPVMDLQNIFTHELGHWVGMGDLYDPGAVDETMFGYSGNGETSKRDLYYGDINGVTKLYK